MQEARGPIDWLKIDGNLDQQSPCRQSAKTRWVPMTASDFEHVSHNEGRCQVLADEGDGRGGPKVSQSTEDWRRLHMRPAVSFDFYIPPTLLCPTFLALSIFVSPTSTPLRPFLSSRHSLLHYCTYKPPYRFTFASSTRSSIDPTRSSLP